MSIFRALFGRAPAASPAPRTAPAVSQESAAADWRAKGNAALGAGDIGEAARCYSEAAAADAHDPLSRLNLGFALLQQGRAQEAESHLVQALALKRPGDDFTHDAQYLLARIYRARQSNDDALAALDAALAAKAGFAEALEEKTDLLLELGRADDAVQSALQLNSIRPDVAGGILGSRALHAAGRNEEALQAIEAVLAHEPGNPAALTGRGNVLLALGRADEALASFETAKSIVGPDADTLSNIAAALVQLGRFDEAARSCDEALALHPGHRETYVNKVYAVRGLLRDSAAPSALHAELAALHRELAELPEALENAEKAIELDPQLAMAHLERARALAQLKRDEEALQACRRACELNPDSENLGTLATLYGRLRLADEALDASRRAVALFPDDLHARSRELFFSNFSEEIGAGKSFELHREYGRMLEAKVPAKYEGNWNVTRDSERKLRIGFVSSDLYRHPVILFLLPLIARIDRDRFDVFCYSTAQTIDETTAEIRAMTAGWADCRLMTDAQIAAKVHEDGIDVLLDLSGHSGTPRLAVFAEKPAPVQMTWLGYLNTTGLTRMDYRLCDERTDPADTQRFNTEELLPFSASQWCYRPFVEVEPAPIAPCVQNGFITFGSFNNARKISAAMCRRWAELLKRCPTARLMLVDVSSAAKRAAIEEAFTAEGVSLDRVEIVPRTDLAGYQRLFDRADISLDTYPYGGGTTTIDSLWMGVPVVTAPGELPVSRSASSILQLLGMDDWVAKSIGDYVDCAVRAAQSPAAVQSLRTMLRGRLRNSPIMDEMGFARDFEAAVRGAWQRFCARD